MKNFKLWKPRATVQVVLHQLPEPETAFKVRPRDALVALAVPETATNPPNCRNATGKAGETRHLLDSVLLSEPSGAKP